MGEESSNMNGRLVTCWRWTWATDDRRIAAMYLLVAGGSVVGVVLQLGLSRAWQATPLLALMRYVLTFSLGFFGLVLIGIGRETFRLRHRESAEGMAYHRARTGQAYACLVSGAIGLIVAVGFGF